MADYKLIYFDARGIVEPVRIMLSVSKTPFEDVRFTPEGEGSMADFKAKGVLAPNLNRAPILYYKGQPISQSKTIERFVARKLGFMGADEIEEAQIDAITEHIRDVKLDYSKIRLGKEGDALEAAKKTFIGEALPNWFERIDKVLTGTNGYAVGSKLSLADITFHNIVLDFFDDKEGAVAACKNAPKVLESARTGEEAAKEWLASRPETKA